MCNYIVKLNNRVKLSGNFIDVKTCFHNMYTTPNFTAIDIQITVLLFLLFTHVHHNVLQIIMLDAMRIAVICIRFPNTCHKVYAIALDIKNSDNILSLKLTVTYRCTIHSFQKDRNETIAFPHKFKT